MSTENGNGNGNGRKLWTTVQGIISGITVAGLCAIAAIIHSHDRDITTLVIQQREAERRIDERTSSRYTREDANKDVSMLASLISANSRAIETNNDRIRGLELGAHMKPIQ